MTTDPDGRGPGLNHENQVALAQSRWKKEEGEVVPGVVEWARSGRISMMLYKRPVNNDLRGRIQRLIHRRNSFFSIVISPPTCPICGKSTRARSLLYFSTRIACLQVDVKPWFMIAKLLLTNSINNTSLFQDIAQPSTPLRTADLCLPKDLELSLPWVIMCARMFPVLFAAA
jgi:hypothetical protein